MFVCSCVCLCVCIKSFTTSFGVCFAHFEIRTVWICVCAFFFFLAGTSFKIHYAYCRSQMRVNNLAVSFFFFVFDVLHSANVRNL